MHRLWDSDGSHLLHLCFENITEYDPDVVFDDNAVFFFSFFFFHFFLFFFFFFFFFLYTTFKC